MNNLIYGKNTIKIAIDSTKIKLIELFLLKEDREIIEKCNKKNIKYSLKDRSFFDSITQDNHQGYIAYYNNYQYINLQQFIENSNKKKISNILILDHITDIGNFASIIRNAAAFNIDAILIHDKKQAQVNEVVHKLSSGSSLIIDIIKVGNLNSAIKILKENLYWIYASNLNSSEYIENLSFAPKSAIVVGSEGKGISQLVSKNSDINFKIRMSQKIDSLNVSSASAIMCYYLFLK